MNLKELKQLINKLKKETNNTDNITYRKKIIKKKIIFIIYNEPLTSSDKISDFIIRSLDKINHNHNINNLEQSIFNEIDNFKTKKYIPIKKSVIT